MRTWKRVPGEVGLNLIRAMGSIPGALALALRFVVDALACGQTHVGLFPVLGAAEARTEAALLARLVDDLHALDLDLEHELDRAAHIGARGVAPHAECVLIALLQRERSLLGDVRREQHVHEPFTSQRLAHGGHCRRSSSNFTAPTVASTLS